jgi:hypothetical protein
VRTLLRYVRYCRVVQVLWGGAGTVRYWGLLYCRVVRVLWGTARYGTWSIALRRSGGGSAMTAATESAALSSSISTCARPRGLRYGVGGNECVCVCVCACACVYR